MIITNQTAGPARVLRVSSTVDTDEFWAGGAGTTHGARHAETGLGSPAHHETATHPA